MEFVEPIKSKSDIEKMKRWLIANKSKRDYFLFLLGINCGLRISDILKLKKKDIWDYEILLKETKTGKRYSFSLFQIKDEIDDYIEFLESEDYLFKSRNGENKPISRTQAYRIISEAGKSIGLDNIGCHSLRKTTGYHHYKQKKDIGILMRLYNHSSTEITMRYLSLDTDELKESFNDFSL